MEYALALFNLWAFGALIAVAAVSAAVYSKVASARERLALMGSFAQSAGLALSALGAFMVVTSPNISFEEIGPMARLVIATGLYAVLFNLACKIWARCLREDAEGAGAPRIDSGSGQR